MPALFGWHLISFWQALGLLVLSKILLGGFRGRPGPRMFWRRRMMERWAQMTPEEREKVPPRHEGPLRPIRVTRSGAEDLTPWRSTSNADCGSRAHEITQRSRSFSGGIYWLPLPRLRRADDASEGVSLTKRFCLTGFKHMFQTVV